MATPAVSGKPDWRYLAAGVGVLAIGGLVVYALVKKKQLDSGDEARDPPVSGDPDPDGLGGDGSPIVPDDGPLGLLPTLPSFGAFHPAPPAIPSADQLTAEQKRDITWDALVKAQQADAAAGKIPSGDELKSEAASIAGKEAVDTYNTELVAGKIASELTAEAKDMLAPLDDILGAGKHDTPMSAPPAVQPTTTKPKALMDKLQSNWNSFAKNLPRT